MTPIDIFSINDLPIDTTIIYSGFKTHLITNNIVNKMHPQFPRFRITLNTVINRQYMITRNIFSFS